MMHPHVPQDLPKPQLEAVTLLVNGTPPHIRQHVPQRTLHSTVAGTVDDILAAEIIAQDAGNDAPANPEQPPVDDDEPEPQYEVGPLADEDEDPQYEVGPLEEEMEHTQIPLIIISSDDEDEEDDDEDMEDPEEIPDDEEDPEEFPLEDEPHHIVPDDGDWEDDLGDDTDSEISALEIEVIR